MSLKYEVETWISALDAYDVQDFHSALELFSRIGNSSKIRVNMGLIFATVGEHALAVDQFKLAIELDQFLALAYFQMGVSNFLLGHYHLAEHDFHNALLYLRGNDVIKYHQLGLAFDLHHAEILFNKGLCKIALGSPAEGLAELQTAQEAKATLAHDVIDEAIRDAGAGYTVFSIPVGVIYRLSDVKVKNHKTKDYLGKAKLITDGSSEAKDVFTKPGLDIQSPDLSPGGRPSQRDTPDKINMDVKLSRSLSTPARSASADPKSAPHTSLRRLNSSPISSPQNRTQAARNVRLAAYYNNNKNNNNNNNGTSPLRWRLASSSPPTPPMPIRRPIKQQQQQPSPLVSPRTDSGESDFSGISEAVFDPVSESLPPLPLRSKLRIRSASVQDAGPLRRRPTLTQTSTAPSTPRTPKTPKTPRSASRSRRWPPSELDEEESGYYSEFSPNASDTVTIMVKLHYGNDVRGMALKFDTPFAEFVDLVTSKFDRTLEELALKFKDEDGMLISLKDDSDYDMAIETARVLAKGRKMCGRLAIWCAGV